MLRFNTDDTQPHLTDNNRMLIKASVASYLQSQRQHLNDGIETKIQLKQRKEQPLTQKTPHNKLK